MSTAAHPITPTVNINGTSAEDLVGHRMAARVLLEAVIHELRQVTPHGRDYPGDSDRYASDRAVHSARLQSLQTLHKTLQEEALLVFRQQRPEYVRVVGRVEEN